MSTMLIGSDQNIVRQLASEGSLRIGTKLNVGEYQGNMVAVINNQIVGVIPAKWRTRVVSHIRAEGYLSIGTVHPTEDGSRYVFFNLNAR